VTVGTSSGRRQSAVVIPVPEAEALVGEIRFEHDPVAAQGVPAHITLIVPWLPPDEIAEGDLVDLERMLEDVAPFDFMLDRVAWFGRGVLWLAPEPADPFIKLTARLVDRFGMPPYDDEFDEVVPHLTVAHASDGVELEPIAQRLRGQLPVRCRAREVWVMEGDGRTWSARRRIPLKS
jgi:2'-5' RNA ligase